MQQRVLAEDTDRLAIALDRAVGAAEALLLGARLVEGIDGTTGSRTAAVAPLIGVVVWPLLGSERALAH